MKNTKLNQTNPTSHQKLLNSISTQKNYLCVGLDSDIEKITPFNFSSDIAVAFVNKV